MPGAKCSLGAFFFAALLVGFGRGQAAVKRFAQFFDLVARIAKPVGRPNPVEVPTEPFEYFLAEPIPITARAGAVIGRPIAFESKVTPPAGIGKEVGSRGVNWFTANDRVVHDWQAFAGKYSPKTVQAHLVSICDFEAFMEGVQFSKVKPKHAGQYRDHLVRLLAQSKEEGGLSNSTVRHRASHLKDFFEWLRGHGKLTELFAARGPLHSGKLGQFLA